MGSLPPGRHPRPLCLQPSEVLCPVYRAQMGTDKGSWALGLGKVLGERGGPWRWGIRNPWAQVGRALGISVLCDKGQVILG